MKKAAAPLWTRDFTILTAGSLISMAGNNISSLAISLLVLDYTGSVLSYALFMVAYSLPMLIMPAAAAPYLDRRPRKKVIYTLDFFSAAFYLIACLLIRCGLMSFPLLLVMAVMIGAVNSVYTVAFDSFFPNLVAPQNLSKAYSISGLLGVLTTALMPLSAVVYERVGLEPLFLFNAATFLIAAVCETQIRAKETHITVSDETGRSRLQKYAADFRGGLRYIRAETGLLLILLFLIADNLCNNVLNTVLLPYFKSAEHLGVQFYTWVTISGVIGRMTGSAGSYLGRIPPRYKTFLLIASAALVCVLCGVQLFLPAACILAAQFCIGAAGVFAYTLRSSGLQAHIPDRVRARFNSAVSVATSLGMICGQLLGGALGDRFSIPSIVAAAMGALLLLTLTLLAGGYRHISPIFNKDLQKTSRIP